jgi:hypothetical protein
MFWAVVISLTVLDLYSKQQETDYRICQITTLQQNNIIRLAKEVNIELNTEPMPPCVKP